MRSGLVLPPTSWRTGWRIEVTHELIRDIGVDRIRSVLPGGYCFAYRNWDRATEYWMPPLIGQIVAFWHHHAHDGHRLLLRLGFLHGKEGGYYREMTWRWDFWNGNRSWFAMRYLGKHGLDAYRARFP